MKIITKAIALETRGDGDLVNITDEIVGQLKGSGMKRGNVTVFVVGSTAAVTTFEYESGLIQDMQELYERIAPRKKRHHHDDTWGDANGFSHVRAALQGPSLTIPFDAGRLLLGTWQQVVLAEFDNRPRRRQVVVQMMGE
ncbi:MAG: secondary thiamine-phosphate synthase enzyme YjbQ [Candidatus Aureabacteria bacterium]|nr:secondary thiamine-phosphate synthase enzyme YjbQ [Candidatus Auribacterota bacterium]